MTLDYIGHNNLSPLSNLMSSQDVVYTDVIHILDLQNHFQDHK